jgi:hypothetical protein
MNTNLNLNLHLELSEDEALAFTQFLKRACLSNYRELAANQDEAYEMQYAGEKLRKAFAQSGFAPR